tara:strand:+ start:4656 stop:4946 length:291 start_codon:yes stop_codon:yes gene_type:complete
MTNLKEVLEFIKNSELGDLQAIINQSKIRKSEIRQDQKSTFKIGDVVGINHKSINSDDSFRITKINIKNINVQKMNVEDGRVAGTIRVSPGLLVKK